MRERFARFMSGRYGMDSLSKFINYIVIILLVISLFRVPYVYIAGLVLLVINYFRIFSRNINRRYLENEKFLAATQKIRQKFSVTKLHMQQSRYYRFYRCPQCRQKMRVPKGKGRICITCPKCRNEFVKVS
ncbi:MAG: hypothetical protein HFG80_07550 [Eubacterium sp.]|nr:hypothetical protein [Eubacterium sp.]